MKALRIHANATWTAFFAICIAMTGCQSIQTRSDWDHTADFSQYHTFSWISKSPLISRAPEVSPLVEGRIQTAVRGELERKGFKFVEDPNKADFVVAFTVGARERLNVRTTPFASGWGRGPNVWGAPYYRDIDVRQYTEGRLAIDMFDVQRREPMWTGVATRSVTSSDQRRTEELINKAVAAILKDFPPAPGAVPR